MDLATDPSTQLATAADRVTHYAYDILGRLVSVQEDATPANTSDATQDTAYTFDLQGRMDTTELPNGVTSDNDYDALGRLDVMTDTDSAGNILAEYDYEVRADGKRTAASETFWLDANEDGAVDAGEYQTRTYDWTYDNANRLTDEVFTDVGDMMNDVDNYHTNFTYDTTGNRLNRTTITDDDGSPGFDANTDSAEATSYLYDANDRLVEELLDSTDNAKDRTTTCSYDQTQQTQKAVTDSENRKLNTVHFAYNLQGRMSSVINDGFDASGTLNARERTSYTYDSKSFRTFLLTETGTSFSPDLNTENWQLKTETQFLADHRNHTGYTQTIRETETAADGSSVTKDYTFGHDEISQRVVERDAAGNITSDTTHLFGHDGHGSVRMLTDLSGVIAQVFTFAAYGSMVAVHFGNGSLAGTTEAAALTSLGYSGEHFDGKAQQQYLRARFYNPANGRFNRLDPFAGNSTDPQSFHKYLYTHGDPVNGIDPSGLTSLASSLSVGGIQGTIQSGIGTISTIVRIYNTTTRLLDIIEYSRTVIGLLGALAQPTPEAAVVALTNELRKKFAAVELTDIVSGFTTAIATIAGDWEDIAKNIAAKAPQIAAEASKEGLRRLPKYVQLQAKGKGQLVFFAPSGPVGSSKRTYIPIGGDMEIGLSVGGGRLFGFGIRTSRTMVDQVFRIDYWDVRSAIQGNPAPTALHVHYHIFGDKHPPAEQFGQSKLRRRLMSGDIATLELQMRIAFCSNNPSITRFTHCILYNYGEPSRVIAEMMGVAVAVWGDSCLVNSDGGPYIEPDDGRVIEDFKLWKLPENQEYARRFTSKALGFSMVVSADVSHDTLHALYDLSGEDDQELYYETYIKELATLLPDLGWAYVPLQSGHDYAMFVTSREYAKYVGELKRRLIAVGNTKIFDVIPTDNGQQWNGPILWKSKRGHSTLW